MSNTKTLTVTQLRVLNAAAQRPGHMILPLPATIRVRGGAQRNLLTTLLKLELVSEIAVDDAASVWRTDEASGKVGLRLTAAGLAAAGVDVEEADAPAPEGSGETVEGAGEGATPLPVREPRVEEGGTLLPAPRRPTGKLGEVLQAISAEAGATLAEITTQTGWLPHTARAAVTGLRQRGFGIQLIKQGDRKAYRLTNAG